MGVKDVIGKLQSVDVKDLKNIDMQQVQDNIRGRPEMIIIILLLAASIGGSVYLYTSFQKTSGELDGEVTKYNEQLEAAEQNIVLTKKFDEFMAAFPEKIVIDDLTDKISGFAIDRNVNIVSFSPAKQQETDYTLVETININVVANEYHQLIAFIRDIEEAPFAIRIEAWTARLDRKGNNRQGRRTRRHEAAKDEDEIPSIAATIEIAAIALKE